MPGLARALRETRVSGQKLADRIGVDRKSVARWKNGQTTPSFEEAVRVALELRVTLNLLAGLPEPGELKDGISAVGRAASQRAAGNHEQLLQTPEQPRNGQEGEPTE